MSDWRTLTRCKLEALNRADRKRAHLARMASADVIHGGARAMAYVDQRARLNDPDTDDLAALVSAIYRTSSRHGHPEYSGFECPECGSAHLAAADALACCE